MPEGVEFVLEALSDFSDLLQCPVCYETPSGQIFQCNEGHHVCGRCKARLEVCPVCRALFFGTRNYAVENLISYIKRLKIDTLAIKVINSSGSGESSPSAEKQEESKSVNSNVTVESEDNSETSSRRSVIRPPPACKGLFRCLCCNRGSQMRLPSARMLNHLRYFHSSLLTEGTSDENGVYVQPWQFTTEPRRLVTAIRVSKMGIFFLVLEISHGSVCTWVSMAAGPSVAENFVYTITIFGIDREITFSDTVWSVKSCEGTLKNNLRCLKVTGVNAHAVISSAFISGKLTLRPSSPDHHAGPRHVVVRIAERVAERGHEHLNPHTNDTEPHLQRLQNNAEWLSRAFTILNRDAVTLARSRQDQRNLYDNQREDDIENDTSITQPQPNDQVNNNVVGADVEHLSRNARRRMRARLRAALNAPQAPSTYADVGPQAYLNHILES